jgi:outer membrane protein assembly factor BamB
LPQEHDDELPAERIKKDEVKRYAGLGMSDAPPVFTVNNVVWGTSKGDVYAATADEMQANFRFRSHGPISAPVTYFPPMLYAASRDGYLYALRDEKGYKKWQFSTGNPVTEKPVVYDDAVFVISEIGQLFRLKFDTGEDQWSVGGIDRFVAASQTRLYMADLFGNLVILDMRTGARLGSMPTEYLSLRITNTETDRIYLGSPSGILQCLHERELVEPFRHGPAEAPDDAKDGKKGDAKPSDAQSPDDKAEMPADDDDNPFGDQPSDE